MSMNDLSWVYHADNACVSGGGCQFARALATLEEASRIMEQRIAMDDDIARWCGVGGHAFSPLDPDRQRVTVQQWDEDAEEMKPVTVSACGDHAQRVQLVTRPKPAPAPPTAPAALSAGPGERLVSAEEYGKYMAFLEAEARKPITEPPAGYNGGT